MGKLFSNSPGTADTIGRWARLLASLISLATLATANAQPETADTQPGADDPDFKSAIESLSGLLWGDDPIDSKLAERGPAASGFAHERLFFITKDNYFHTSEVLVPGYYTLVFFSAKTCAPCGAIRENFIPWLDSLPSLVIVDIDLEWNNDVRRDQSRARYDEKLLTSFGCRGRGCSSVAVPAALLFDPFGIYIVGPPQSGWEVISGQPHTYRMPPLTGESILTKMPILVSRARFKSPVPLGVPNPFERVKALALDSYHYAVQEGEPAARKGEP